MLELEDLDEKNLSKPMNYSFSLQPLKKDNIQIEDVIEYFAEYTNLKERKFSRAVDDPKTGDEVILISSAEEETIVNILNISLNFCEKFGYNKNELIGKKVTIFFPEIYRNIFINVENGFIEVLNGAKKSNDSETLESIMPKEVDLSIRQNGGFSVFLWLHTMKAKGGKPIYYIFKKGGTVDQFTPSIGLSNNQANLLIELSTSKSKKETLFANKKIEDNHLYSIGISFSINYEEDSTEVSLYIDGKLDTQSSIPGEPIHNQGSVFFCRPDSSTHGFKGTVADVMMVPSTITEKEVSLAHSEGLKNLYDSNGATLGMNNVFGEIFKRKNLYQQQLL